eukprot:225405_1
MKWIESCLIAKRKCMVFYINGIKNDQTVSKEIEQSIQKEAKKKEAKILRAFRNKLKRPESRAMYSLSLGKLFDVIILDIYNSNPTNIHLSPHWSYNIPTKLPIITDNSRSIGRTYIPTKQPMTTNYPIINTSKRSTHHQLICLLLKSPIKITYLTNDDNYGNKLD